MLPRAFFCNGMILVNGIKMSKSLGNFFTMKQMIDAYGADATRISLSDAGDQLDDANFVMKTAELAILKLNHLYEWIE